LHQKSVEAHLKDFWLPDNYVGNGPYKLTKYKQNGTATLVLNTNYWDAKNYSITTRDIQFNSSGSTGMMLSYNSNEIDIFRVDGDPTALIAGRSDVAKQLKNGSFVQFKGVQVLPCANPILYENPKLRQALAMAVDREALAKVSPPDVAGPSWVPSGIDGADQLTAIPFDPDGAKQLLSDAGFPDGKGVPTLQILTYATMPVLEAVGQMWTKHLNIKAKVAVQEVGVYSDMLRGNLPKDFVGYAFNYQAPTPCDMMRYGATRYFEGSFVPYDTHKQIYDMTYGADKAKYTAAQQTQLSQELYDKNDLPEYLKYRDLADRAKAAQADPDRARDLATQACQTLQDTYLWVPLLWAGYAFMEKPRVHNLTFTSYVDAMFTLKGVTLDPVRS
jgi:ABC-type transport system substrate-binding protein